MRRFAEVSLLAFIAGALVVQSDIPGDIEGGLFPVVGPASLELVREVDGVTLYAAEAEKLRDCEWVRTEWFLGDIDGRAAQADMRHLDPPEVRTPGALSWDAIEVDLTDRQVRRNSYAYVYHKCHGDWLWETRSLFFLGSPP